MAVKGSALTIDAQPVLDAARLYKLADKEWRKDARRRVNRYVVPYMRRQMAARAVGPQSQKIVSRAIFRTGSNPSVSVRGYGPLQGLHRHYEFGGNRRYRNPGYNSRSPKGRRYAVHDRLTQRQIPSYQPDGRWFYPTMAAVGPELARAYVASLAEAYREAISG